MLDITQTRTYIFSSDKDTRSQQENQTEYLKAEQILEQNGFEPLKTFGKYQGRTENCFIVSVDTRSEWQASLLECLIFGRFQQDSLIYQEESGGYVLMERRYRTYEEGYGFKYTRTNRAKLEDPPARPETDHAYIPHKGKFLYLEF